MIVADPSGVEHAEGSCASPRTHLPRHYRIARRRGKDKAAVAVAHSLLVIADPLLKIVRPFSQLGAERIERHHIRRLQHLGKG